MTTPDRPALDWREVVECPCCGDDGATADANGEFYDGQPLECGCPGHVCVDEDGDVWVNNGDEPCPKLCGATS